MEIASPVDIGDDTHLSFKKKPNVKSNHKSIAPDSKFGGTGSSPDRTLPRVSVTSLSKKLSRTAQL